jgi:hypothetical protein
MQGHFPQVSRFINASARLCGQLCSLKAKDKKMADDDEIFKHVMQKKIGEAEYWREIRILEEGPFVFRVVQEVQQGVVDSTGNLKALRPIGPRRAEWVCASREAATEQALKCLHQSQTDNWLFPPSATSAA